MNSLEQIQSFNYESYRAKSGGLSEVEYTRASMGAIDPLTQIKHSYLENAKFMAEFADINVPIDTFAIYAILRAENAINGEEIKNYMKMGDQVLLAEVLYRQGNTEILNKFIKAYPNIFN